MSLPIVLAVQFSPVEQQIIGLIIEVGSILGALGYLIYKFGHLIEQMAPKIAEWTPRLIDDVFDAVEQVKRRIRELRSESRHVPDPVPRP